MIWQARFCCFFKDQCDTTVYLGSMEVLSEQSQRTVFSRGRGGPIWSSIMWKTEHCSFYSAPSVGAPSQKPCTVLSHLCDLSKYSRALRPLPISAPPPPSFYNFIRPLFLKYHLYVLFISPNLSSIPQTSSSPTVYLTSHKYASYCILKLNIWFLFILLRTFALLIVSFFQFFRTYTLESWLFYLFHILPSSLKQIVLVLF